VRIPFVGEKFFCWKYGKSRAAAPAGFAAHQKFPSVPAVPSDRRAMDLLETERLHRIEPRRLHGGVEPKEQAHGGREAEGDGHGPSRDHARPSANVADDPGA